MHSLRDTDPATIAGSPSLSARLPTNSRLEITGTPFIDCPRRLRNCNSNCRFTSEAPLTEGLAFTLRPRSS